MRRRLAGLVILATVVAIGVFIAFPEMDLAVGRSMLGPDGRFLLGWSRFFNFLHDVTPYWVGLCIGAFALLAVARYLGRPAGGLGIWHALYIAAVFAIGPGFLANTVLKDNSGRPRPVDVLQFQGGDVYVGPFAFNGACDHNCSFVAGDPAAAFAFLAPALLLPPPRRKWGVAAAFAFGLLVGLMRMYQGGHFLSDVIFAGIVSWSTALGLHWLMFRADGRPRGPAGRHLFPAVGSPSPAAGPPGAVPN
jgi:lipid A 4'-phosphatase